jgi:long-chain acyl-CoA synthetase
VDYVKKISSIKLEDKDNKMFRVKNLIVFEDSVDEESLMTAKKA